MVRPVGVEDNFGSIHSMTAALASAESDTLIPSCPRFTLIAGFVYSRIHVMAPRSTWF